MLIEQTYSMSFKMSIPPKNLSCSFIFSLWKRDHSMVPYRFCKTPPSPLGTILICKQVSFYLEGGVLQNEDCFVAVIWNLYTWPGMRALDFLLPSLVWLPLAMAHSVPGSWLSVSLAPLWWTPRLPPAPVPQILLH